MSGISLKESIVLGSIILAGFTEICHAQDYEFTNCGATGINGPTQAQVNTAYSGTSLEGEVTINTQGIQEWEVPETMSYEITVAGAQGGGLNGGKGAVLTGIFELEAGDVIKILVGQQGDSLTTDRGDYSGGGGTYVATSSNLPLIVAGGGGGAAAAGSGSAGQITTYGSDGTNSDSYDLGSGGTDGSGGTTKNQTVDAGAGFTGNGGSSWTNKPKSFVNGGVGSANEWSSNTAVPGGFGGGGGASRGHTSFYTGGGGGGYSGGGSAYGGNVPIGGGGGSYNAGTEQNNIEGSNTGDGYVIINFLCEDIIISGASTDDICTGSAITLTGTSNYGGTITWDNGIENGVEFTFTETTTYTATSTTFQDCKTSVTITEKEIELLALELDTIKGECSVTVSAPSLENECFGTITATTSDPLEYDEQGEYTISWNFSDGNGYELDTSQVVIVKDTTMPSITCDSEVSVTTYSSDGYTVTGDEFYPDYSDNCTVNSIVNDYNNTETLANEVISVGTTSITWTVTDVAGNTNSCSTEITVDKASSVTGSNDENGISVYPNPVSDIVEINLSESSEKGTFRLLSLAGKVIASGTIENGLAAIDISETAPGLYFLSITQNNKELNYKIIKE